MIKELTPLQALEKIGNAETKDTSFGTEIKTNLSNEYRIIENSLKALEIIKKKKVDTYFLMQTDTLEEYNNSLHTCSWFPNYELTQEEYKLLKENLK